MPVIKYARKRSADPVQEKLRQDKDIFNKEVSTFITKVINFKKLMNGAPNLFYKQKSKITQPIPANPSNILTTLISDFQELAQRGTGLVEEQLNYSKNHRPSQPKAPNALLPKAPSIPEASPSAPDLTKQLAAWEQKYDLIAEASNPISRFLARRLTRTRGTSERFRINRMRLDMLESCTQARKALGKLQVQIVKGSKESIVESHKVMQHVWNEWAVVSRTFNNYKNKLSNQPSNQITELPAEETFSGAKETLPDQAPQEENEDTGIASPSDPPKVDAPVMVQKIPPPILDLPTPVTPPTTNVLPIGNKELEATAQAFIKKWLGKKRHQFFSQNTSSYRLEIFEMAKNTRIELNKVMNLLEKGLDVNQLETLVSQVNKQITTLRMMMRSLHLSEKPDASNGQMF